MSAHEWLSPGGYTALPMRDRTRMRVVFMGANLKGPCPAMSTTFLAPALVADLGNALDVFDLKVPASFQYLKGVFLAGKAQLLRPLLPEKHDRGPAACEGLLARGAPREEDEGIAVAPGWSLVVVERRPAIVADASLSHWRITTTR